MLTKNVSKIANDILKSAQFTIKKKLKLDPEGITKNSRANAHKIYDSGYGLIKAVMSYDRQAGKYELNCIFNRDGEKIPYTFTGFSFGFGGEGPNGLREFSELFNIGLKDEEIFSTTIVNRPEKGTWILV